MDKTDLTLLKKGILDLQLSLDDQQIDQIEKFVNILMKWNKAFNLTAIVEPSEIITHHILDSLSIVPFIRGKKILDVGSGAGLPGIPCAIALRDHKFVMLDSNGKKTRFMTQAIGELKIKNASVIQSRIEDFKPEECFEVITARAFAAIEKIVTVTKQQICADGELLIMKGIYPQAELQNISNHAKVYPLSVPGLNEQRHLVCIKGLFS